MGVVRLLAAIGLALFFAVSSNAQSATLLADSVTINGNDTITASGNVEVLFGDARLKATRIIYNDADGTLQIEGPLTLTDGDTTVILADAAEMSTDLQQGILSSARMVLNEQLQIAASEIARVDGRYTQLYKTVASSCRVCASNPVPLWQIRAQKIIHDQVEKQLYFEKAQFLVGNVPVFYLPRLRMPDPTLKRATGFLIPKFKKSTRLGAGLKIPYFITLGDHADLTVSPYIAAETRTLELRYRQAFRTGNIEFNGAISDDTLNVENRAYLFGHGDFVLPRNFQLSFDVEWTSDSAYLLEYGYSGKDRLESSIAVTRTQNDEFINAKLTNFRTLRGSELAIDDQLPNFQGELLYEKRFFPQAIGGQGSYELSLRGHTRQSTLDQFGRDVTKIGGKIDWGRSHIFSNGMVGRVGGALAADAYYITHDSTYPDTVVFVTPSVETELRWPFVKTGARGASMVLEPVVHLAWTDPTGKNVPNDDSTLVEFDEGNLFALSRFPGNDRYERGLRATAGVKWTRYDPDGWSLGIAIGRVTRADDLGQFTRASGLDGVQSDWMLATQLKLDSRLSLTARTQLQNDLSATKAETRIDWTSERLTLASSYSWMLPDPEENRSGTTSQMALDASYLFGRHWLGRTDWRYDFDAQETTRAGFGLVYENECISVDLSLSRRFTSSSSVKPNTEFGLSISLNGFGGSGRVDSQTCSG